MKTAVCPGSYDPVTIGHLDVIRSTSHLFSKVFVVVASNSAKNPLFTSAERAEFIREAVQSLGLQNVEVVVDDGLLADFVKKVQADVIIKGLRPAGDYEVELSMALMNRHLSGVETLFIPAVSPHSHIASSFIKDVASHGGDVSDMVPTSVANALKAKFNSGEIRPKQA